VLLGERDTILSGLASRLVTGLLPFTICNAFP
jgi:hypothetical protein